ncbi:MAG TPA: hypothetical protein VOA87_22280 [Thermoanaerobaculia bacterium]|nr:hypothetical protein [Thermoanaerobaculia bacterium]
MALAVPVAAQSHAAGSLIVEGKTIPITQVYAFAQKGFFDTKKQDVVIVLCDSAVPPAAVHDQFARADLVKAGKLHCIEQTVDADKQVINYKVQHNRFKMPEGGGSTEHRFDATTFDGKTIAGRSWTRSPQKSFDDVPYSYDVTFSAPIEPKK